MHTIYPYSLFILYSWFISLNSYPYLAPPTFPSPQITLLISVSLSLCSVTFIYFSDYTYDNIQCWSFSDLFH